MKVRTGREVPDFVVQSVFTLLQGMSANDRKVALAAARGRAPLCEEVEQRFARVLTDDMKAVIISSVKRNGSLQHPVS